MIRPFLRSILITGVSLWAAAQLAGGGIVFAQGFTTFALSTVAASIGNHFIRPLLNILLLPINLITLGAFRWVTNVIMLYLVTLIVPGFHIMFFDFGGIAWQGISIPAFHLGGIGALLAVSFVMSIISSILLWLSH